MVDEEVKVYDQGVIGKLLTTTSMHVSKCYSRRLPWRDFLLGKIRTISMSLSSPRQRLTTLPIQSSRRGNNTIVPTYLLRDSCDHERRCARSLFLLMAGYRIEK